MANMATTQPSGLTTTVRLGFGGVSLVFAIITNHFTASLPWILLIVSLDLVATAVSGLTTLPRTGVLRSRITLLALNAAFSGVAFTFAGGATAPLALIPAYHSGLLVGRRGFAVTYLVTGGSAAAAFVFLPAQAAVGLPPLLAWLLSVAMLGALGTWSHRTTQAEPDDPTAREAVALIARLHELADDLGTGLDAPAHAAAVLDDLSAFAKCDRSFLLFGAEPERAVPVASRGATRMPWAGDGSGAEVLERAWAADGATVFETQTPAGPRAVMSIPLMSVSGDKQGVLIADRRAPFTDAEMIAATEMFSAHQTRLNAAMLFADLKARAGVEERRRLAREMHDGIAQELAALGYAIDAARMVASATHNPMASDLDALRATLKATLADVRGHIADLKMPQRPETGLGATLGAAVQDFGAVTGLRTIVSTRETGLRLPGHIELLAYRLAMDSLVDAKSGAATEVMLELESHEPDLTITVSHNGKIAPTRGAMLEKWEAAGGRFLTEKRPEGHVLRFLWSADRSGDSASGAAGVMAS